MSNLFKITVLLLSTIMSQTHLCVAQTTYISLSTGMANYQGDLQQKQLTLAQAGNYIGLQVHKAYNGNISIRGGISRGTIQASDANSTKAGNKARNLSFKNTVYELHIVGEYHFLNIEERRFSPYIFAGLAAYHHNPYAVDSKNQIIYLQPLSTEGQGLLDYTDRKKYSLNNISIPVGGGIKYNLTQRIRIGAELGFRKSFTDYLDDVSTTYVDGIKLLNAKGANAVELSYRADELPGGNLNYPTDGTTRGSAKNKDWYYFLGVHVGFLLHSIEGSVNKPNTKRYVMGCPKRW